MQKYLLEDMVGNGILEVLNKKSPKGYKRKKYDEEQLKTIIKYSQINRFHNYYRIQVKMRGFVYVYLETTPDKDYFPCARKFAKNYKKISTTGPMPKLWLDFF